MDKVPKKLILVASFAVSGASAFFVYLVNSKGANLGVSILFNLVSTSGFIAMDCLGVELFPTELRGSGLALASTAGRLGAIVGNLVFGYLVEVDCAIPVVSVAVLLIGGGVLGLFLPKTTTTE